MDMNSYGYKGWSDKGKGKGGKGYDQQGGGKGDGKGWKGKGKGYEGKGQDWGKGSWQDKGKGKGKPNDGLCGYCKLPGHYVRNCPKAEADWWNGTFRIFKQRQAEEAAKGKGAGSLEEGEVQEKTLAGLGGDIGSLGAPVSATLGDFILPKPKKASKWKPVRVEQPPGLATIPEDKGFGCLKAEDEEEEEELWHHAVTNVMPICNFEQAKKAADEASKKPRKGKMLKRSLTIDSGAAKCALPSGWLPEYKLKPSKESLAGVKYVAANGQTIPDEGMKEVSMATVTGTRTRVKFAVTGVNKPLGSVGCMCDEGYEVVFNDRTGSYIKDLNDGECIPLRKENGVYLMDVWVLEPSEGNAMCPMDAGSAGDAAEGGSTFSRPEQ